MNWWVLALRLAGLGWYVALCIVAGIAGGAWLDSQAGTKGLFLLLGAILGSVLAFWGLYKMVQPILYGAKRKNESRKGGKG